MSETAAARLAAKFKKYSDLPDKIRDSNVKLVGEYLVALNDRRMAHIPYASVVSDLANCVTKGRPVNLFTQGFAIHQRNLRPDQLSDLFSRIELKGLWPKVGQDAWLRGHLGITHDGTENARRKLNLFIDERNNVAHRGPNYQTLGPSDVLDYINFFRCLVWSLADVVEQHLAAY